jgi:hypothetical protein
MDKASLPVLTSIIMLTQAVLAAPMGSIAKGSVGARNLVIMSGTAVLVAANAAFAFIPSFTGDCGSACCLSRVLGLQTHG